MKCHSCSHSDAIQRGEYNSKPWSEIPCSSCHLGQSTVSSVPFDEENPPVPAPDYPSSLTSDLPWPGAAFGKDGCPLTAASSHLIPADVLSQFVQGLLSLPSELRDIVAWRYQGVPYKEIACRQGISTQLAEMRHKRALREWPVLQSLFPYKTAKRLRRLSRR